MAQCAFSQSTHFINKSHIYTMPRGPNAYAKFVQEQCKRPDIKALKPKERFKKCGELWREHKLKQQQSKSDSK